MLERRRERRRIRRVIYRRERRERRVNAGRGQRVRVRKIVTWNVMEVIYERTLEG